LKIKFFPTTGKELACDVSQVTGGSGQLQAAGVLFYPQHGPSGHQGQQAANLSKICVEKDDPRDCTIGVEEGGRGSPLCLPLLS
jgi:hypothetical protein